MRTAAALVLGLALIGAAGAGLLMRHSDVHGLRATMAREHRALYAQVMRDYGSRSGA